MTIITGRFEQLSINIIVNATILKQKPFKRPNIELHLDKPIAMITGRFERLSINIIVDFRQFYRDKFSFFAYFDLKFIEYANTYLFLQLLP